jgi:hypothetical protein
MIMQPIQLGVLGIDMFPFNNLKNRRRKMCGESKTNENSVDISRKTPKFRSFHEGGHIHVKECSWCVPVDLSAKS